MIRLFLGLRVGYWLAVLVFFGVSQSIAGTVTVGATKTCDSYDTVAVETSGNVSITNCQMNGGGSTNATFTVLANGTSPASVTQGGTLPITVIRSGTGLAVDNNVGLTLNGSAITGTNGATVNFLSPTDNSKSFGNVTFASVGTATLNLSGTPTGSNIRVIPATVTVNSSGTGCSNQIVATEINGVPLNLLALNGLSQDVTGMMAFHFKIAANTNSINIYYETSSQGAGYNRNPMDTTVSTCTGDFTAAAMAANCSTRNTFAGPTLTSVTSATGCLLTPGTDYYLNIRPAAPNLNSGIYFTIH